MTRIVTRDIKKKLPSKKQAVKKTKHLAIKKKSKPSPPTTTRSASPADKKLGLDDIIMMKPLNK